MKLISTLKFPAFFKFFSLLIFLQSLYSCSPTRNLRSNLDKSFSTSEAFEKGFSGLVLYDPQEVKIIYEKNGSKYFTPASNIKLFTFYTGLKLLEDSIPGIKYHISNDSLIFTGTGDPSLLNPDLPSSGVVDFLRNSDEKLFFAPAEPAEAGLGPGWAWDDYNAYYSAERSDFPIYANQVIFEFEENNSIPKVFPEFFRDSLKPAEEFTGSRIRRNAYNNKFLYSEKERREKFQQYIPFKTSPQLAVQLLEDSLQREIQILEDYPIKQLKEVFYSIPSDSLYKQMLEVSDNFLAEQILLMAAAKISDSLKTSIAIDYMKEHYLDELPDEPRWVDGSGLSRYNLVTPRSMVKLLEKINEEVPYTQLFQMLPVGGKTGTLRNRLHAAEPFVFAKTGSLSNNHSLSGFLKTRKGKILIFSFMNSNYTVPPSLLRAEMDRILTQIRDSY